MTKNWQLKKGQKTNAIEEADEVQAAGQGSDAATTGRIRTALYAEHGMQICAHICRAGSAGGSHRAC